jgi:hypothetical protein
MENDAKAGELYIVASGNTFQMAKGADCVDVRTGEHLTFDKYETFEKYICQSKWHRKVRKKSSNKGRGRSPMW